MKVLAEPLAKLVALISSKQKISMMLLTENNINDIKVAKGSANTFISISSIITDVSIDKNPAVPISLLDPLQVSTYTPDEVPPMLVSFNLDLSNDRLTITFDEPVQTSTVMLSLLKLQNNASDTAYSRQLSGGSVMETANASRVITIALAMSDIRALKLNSDLASNVNNTYLVIANNSFTDNAGNMIIEITSSVSDFIDDTVRAELLSFGINMETGVLNLTFSDIVDASTLDASGITIQNDQIADQDFRVTLSPMSTTNSSDGYLITVQIDPLDLLRIKSVDGLATSGNVTFITIQAFTIDDSSGKDVLAITNGKALQVSNFIADTVPPMLESFLLDLNFGKLNITFTDTVDETQLNISLFTLLDSPTPPSLEIEISGDVVRSDDGRTISVSVNSTILDNIKNDTRIGTSLTDTYLAVGSGAITDLAGNFLVEIPISMANASELINDMTGPSLVSFTLDQNLGQLIVTFSEIVKASSVVPSAYTLQSKRDVTFFPDERYTFTTGVALTTDDAVVVIRFDEVDLNGMFAVTALGNTVDDTYLSINSTAVVDIGSIPAIPQPISDGVQASSVILDDSSPRLIDYSLDMDEGLLSLTYSEVVLVSSVNFAGFTILGGMNSSFPSVTLSSGTTNALESVVLNITFSDVDRFAIQAATAVATNASTTFLSTTNDSISDTQNYVSVPIEMDSASPINPAKYTPDTTPPVLRSFDFDLNQGILEITFDEVVDLPNIDITKIVLRSTSNMTMDTLSPDD